MRFSNIFYLYIAIILTLFLIFYSFYIEPYEISIKKINNDKGYYLNKNVKLKGNISSAKKYDDFQVLTLNQDKNKISLLVNDLKTNYTGKKVIVFGKVSTYNDNYQINVNKILEI